MLSTVSDIEMLHDWEPLLLTRPSEAHSPKQAQFVLVKRINLESTECTRVYHMYVILS